MCRAPCSRLAGHPGPSVAEPCSLSVNGLADTPTLLCFQLLLGQLGLLFLRDHTWRGGGWLRVRGTSRALRTLGALLALVAVIIKLHSVLLQGQEVILLGLDGKAYWSK